nr:unnamed protein product [Callosobruchus chinensis]
MISKSIGIPSHFEVTVISVIAICVLSLDRSVSTLGEDLQEIWDYDFGEKIQEEDVKMYLKYSLSGVVLMKALTLHLFLASHFLLLWTTNVMFGYGDITQNQNTQEVGRLFHEKFLDLPPISQGTILMREEHTQYPQKVYVWAVSCVNYIIGPLSVEGNLNSDHYLALLENNEEKPNLILPWLFIGLFRSIFLNVLAFSTGLYVCLIQKGYHPVCLEYVLAQAIQHGPEVYYKVLMLSSRSRPLIDERTSTKVIPQSKNKYISRTKFIDSMEDGRNVITESAIDNVINHMKSMQCPSRSLDALINLKSSKIRKNYYEIEDGPEKRKHPNIYTYEKDQPVSSLEKKLTLSIESVYQEAIANEVELGCISLGGSNTSCFHSENED